MSSIRPYVYLDALKKRLTIIKQSWKSIGTDLSTGRIEINEYPKIPNVKSGDQNNYPGDLTPRRPGFNG
jgi:hypothetical protein